MVRFWLFCVGFELLGIFKKKLFSIFQMKNSNNNYKFEYYWVYICSFLYIKKVRVEDYFSIIVLECVLVLIDIGFDFEYFRFRMSFFLIFDFGSDFILTNFFVGFELTLSRNFVFRSGTTKSIQHFNWHPWNYDFWYFDGSISHTSHFTN